MQERAGAQRAARLLLRALLLAGAALVVVLLGSSTAQADDPDAAPEAPTATGSAAAPEQPAAEERPAPAGPAPRPAHHLASVEDRVDHVTAAVHRTSQQVVASTTRTVRETGRQAPVVEPVTAPVTEAVAVVVDRTAGRIDSQVTEVAKAAEALVDGAVADVADVAKGVPAGSAPVADVESAPAADPVASSTDTTRRTDRSHSEPAAPPTPAFAGAVQDIAHIGPVVRPAPTPDVPPLNAILELGAFSGAPSAGSGAVGGPSSTATLPTAFLAPADESLGVVTHADEERLFALPLTPGWSPD